MFNKLNREHFEDFSRCGRNSANGVGHKDSPRLCWKYEKIAKWFCSCESPEDVKFTWLSSERPKFNELYYTIFIKPWPSIFNWWSYNCGPKTAQLACQNIMLIPESCVILPDGEKLGGKNTQIACKRHLSTFSGSEEYFVNRFAHIKTKNPQYVLSSLVMLFVTWA